MFSVDVHTRVYIASEPVDFRRQIDGLALIVQDTLEMDPFCAHLFVFTNKQKDKLKLLYWHHNGYVLIYKRLEKGRFVWPSSSGAPLCISVRELHSLIEGGDIARLPAINPVHCSRI